MNLQEHYLNLYQNSIKKIDDGNYEVDPQIDDSRDTRLGITLVLRPSLAVKTKIQHFLNELKSIDPDQYYYPNSDIHITVMSIISCYQGFSLKQIDADKYIGLIRECLIKDSHLPIHFKGLTASPSCVMVQGFMGNNVLNDLRDRLRVAFKNSTLEQSIDKRYSIQTAHATVVRFRQSLARKDEFVRVVEKYKDFDFGIFEMDELELVLNDWYHKREKVKSLQRFRLKN